MEFSVQHQNVDMAQAEMARETARIRAELARLEGIAKQTFQYWTGQAQTAYHAAQAQWNAAATDMERQLATRSQTLGEINQNYRRADAQAAGQF